MATTKKAAETAAVDYSTMNVFKKLQLARVRFLEAGVDKSGKHMYELNNKVRLIDVSGFPVKNADEFVGFICGILSQDHDLEQVYLDSFLTTAKLEGKDATETLDQLSAIGETFKVSFIISMSLDKEEVPEAYQDKIICAL